MHNKDIAAIMGFDPLVEGIGIEIEMETLSNKEFPTVDGWRRTHDGSLRGNSVEYVFSSPASHTEYKTLLGKLRKKLSDKDIQIEDSIRAGVHVHVNVRDLTFEEMINFILTYWCIEIPLMKFCGESRVSNLFCLRLVDAEGVAGIISEVVRNPKRNLNLLNSDSLRYSGCNVRSLYQYGTIEFRGMKTYPDLSRIEEFTDTLIKFKEYTRGKSRRDILYDISFFGAEEWARRVLEDKFELISYEGIGKDIMRSVRICQQFVYAGE